MTAPSVDLVGSASLSATGAKAMMSVPLDTGYILVVFLETTNLSCRVLDVTGTTPVWGARRQIATGVLNLGDIDRIPGTAKAALTITSGSIFSQTIFGVIVERTTGTTTTNGSFLSMYGPTSSVGALGSGTVGGLSSTRFVVSDDEDPDNLRVYSVTGTAIALVTTAAVDVAYDAPIKFLRLDDTHLMFKGFGTQNLGVVSIVGTTVTWGSPYASPNPGFGFGPLHAHPSGLVVAYLAGSGFDDARFFSISGLTITYDHNQNGGGSFGDFDAGSFWAFTSSGYWWWKHVQPSIRDLTTYARLVTTATAADTGALRGYGAGNDYITIAWSGSSTNRDFLARRWQATTFALADVDGATGSDASTISVLLTDADIATASDVLTVLVTSGRQKATLESVGVRLRSLPTHVTAVSNQLSTAQDRTANDPLRSATSTVIWEIDSPAVDDESDVSTVQRRSTTMTATVDLETALAGGVTADLLLNGEVALTVVVDPDALQGTTTEAVVAAVGDELTVDVVDGGGDTSATFTLELSS